MIKSVDAIRKQDELSAFKLKSLKNKTSVEGISMEEFDKLIPPNLKAKGRDRISKVIQSKSSEISKQIIPRLTDLADKLGIGTIGAFPPSFPKFCPTPSLIERVLNIRNNIVAKLNATLKYVQIATTVLGGFSILLRTTNNALRGFKIAKQVQVIAIAARPVADGPSVASINAQIDLINLTLDKSDKLSANVDGITLAINVLKLTLTKVIDLLSKIDFFLKKCMDEQQNTNPMTPLNIEAVTLEEEQAVNADQNTVDTTYNGFVLEVVKKPYGNGLTQSVGIAKNQSGIILLQTEPSFTLNPQSLIDELKLKIDSENLVGY